MDFKVIVIISAVMLTSVFWSPIFDDSAFAQSGGDLKSPSSSGSFDGPTLGNYSIVSNGTEVNITAAMNIGPSAENVFKAWLATNATDQGPANYTDLGLFDSNNKISLVKSISNITAYQSIVITEEPQILANNTIPSTPVAGGELTTR